MATKTKTVKMLLYDGALNGVMNISDSAWESGKMYSAPRESINDLISRADCKKYGVLSSFIRATSVCRTSQGPGTAYQATLNR